MTTILNDDVMTQLINKDPFLTREQTARYLNVQPSTLAARDSRKSHTLKRYKFGRNGRVMYRLSDIQEHIRQQQMPD